MSNPPSTIPYFGQGTNTPNQETPLSTINNNSSSLLAGFTYPLQLDGRGGLSLSFNDDRIEQQILEILDTQFNERVLRLEFGTNDYLFDTLSEAVIEAQLQRILETYVKNTDLKVKVYVDENGACDIRIYYSYLGGLDGLVRYNFISKDNVPYRRK